MNNRSWRRFRTLAVFLCGVFSADVQAQGSTAPAGAPASPSPSRTPAAPVPGNEVHGIVLLPNGRPAAKARVGFAALPVLGEAYTEPRFAETDDRGAFRFSEVTRGGTLLAYLPPHGAVAAPGRAGERVTLRLDVGVTVTGDVVDAGSNRPLAGAVVEVAASDAGPFTDADPDFSVVRSVTDAKGRFSLPGIPRSGTQTLRARAKGYGQDAQTYTPLAPHRFRLKPGHDLVGRVVDGLGRPVSGATISLQGVAIAAGSKGTARSGKNGAFEVPGLKDIPYDVTVLADGFAPFTRPGLTADTTTLQVTLDRAVTLTGRLIDSDGASVKGMIRLRSHDGVAAPSDYGRRVMASIGTDGRFRFQMLRPGTNVVQLAGNGHAAIERTIEVARGGDTHDLGDVVLDPGLMIRGQVVEEGGAPIGAARISVVVAQRSDGAVPLFVEADSEGRFEASGLEQRSYRLSVAAEGFVALNTSLAPSENEQSLTMKRAIRVTGRVVAASSGEAVGRAQVRARKGNEMQTSRMAASDGEGRFTLDLTTTGTFSFAVNAEGFEWTSKDVDVTGSADIGDLAISPGLSLKGVVVDAKGLGIAGARVENETRPEAFPRTFAESDERGNFELRGVSEGSVRVSASREGYAPAQATAEAKASGDVDPVRIVLTQGGRIEGSVRRRDGAPVPQAVVLRSSSGSALPLTLTDAGGSFVFDNVLPGRTTISLMSGSATLQTSVSSVEVMVLEGETALANLVLHATTVRGVVRKNGNPVSGARVAIAGRSMSVAMMRGGASLPSLSGDIPWNVAETSRDGAYAVRVVSPQPCQITVSDGSTGAVLDSREIAIPDADDLVVDVDLRGIPVRGRVVDAEAGSPVQGAAVLVHNGLFPGASSRVRRNATTDDRGAFSLEIDEGEYQMSVSADGFATAESEIRVAGPESSAGDIALGRGGILSGRVITPSGKPLAGVTVQTTSGGTPRSGRTEPDGRFTIRGLPASSVLLQVFSGELIGMLYVDRLTPDPVEIHLVPAATLNVRLAGPDSDKAQVAVVEVDGQRVPVGFVPLATSAQTALRTMPGNVTVRAWSATGEGQASFGLQPGETREITLELKPVRR